MVVFLCCLDVCVINISIEKNETSNSNLIIVRYVLSVNNVTYLYSITVFLGHSSIVFQHYICCVILAFLVANISIDPNYMKYIVMSEFALLIPLQNSFLKNLEKPNGKFFSKIHFLKKNIKRNQ